MRLQMSDLIIEIIIVLLLIFANSIFAMSELAILSARKARLQQQAKTGDQGAKAALELAQEPNRFLSTVQIGITLIGILTGAFGGATIAEEIAALLNEIQWLTPYSEAIGIGIVVVVIAYLSLVLGELVPKRIGLSNAEIVATVVSPLMNVLSQIATPAVRLLSASTDVVLRILRVQPSQGLSVTEEEIKLMIYEGTRVGVFEEVEKEIVERVFRLGDRKVSTMMTYRTEVDWLDIDDSQEENLQKVALSGHSCFPVCHASLDQILGIIHVKDLFAFSQTHQSIDLKSILLPPLFIPESMTALEVLAIFKEKKDHMALVFDEFGGVTGLVTLKDVLETIVGDIPSVEEGEEPQVIYRADGSLLLDGLLSIDEFKVLLDLSVLPDEEGGMYETIGGLLMAQLGRIPASGDSIEISNWHIEVVDMDGYRVDKVLITPQE